MERRLSAILAADVVGYSRLSQLLSALENAGIEFIHKNGGGPGVRLK